MLNLKCARAVLRAQNHLVFFFFFSAPLFECMHGEREICEQAWRNVTNNTCIKPKSRTCVCTSEHTHRQHSSWNMKCFTSAHTFRNAWYRLQTLVGCAWVVLSIICWVFPIKSCFEENKTVPYFLRCSFSFRKSSVLLLFTPELLL